MFKEEQQSREKPSPSAILPQQQQQFSSPEALQSELERMLAQLSREAEAVKAEELLDEAGVGDSEDGDEEEEDGEEEEGEEDGTKPMAESATSPEPSMANCKPGRGAGKCLNGALLPNGKKTKGRVKIKMEYIANKLRRYTTFSKRKTGIMKKANELSTLTGTQVMLLVASETGHVYAFATSKLKAMILSEPGKQLIQNCLNIPDDQLVDPAPTRTEFTFEPPALGLSPMGGLANGQSNPRKRKAPTALLLMDSSIGGTGIGGDQSGGAAGTMAGMPSSSSSIVGHLLNGCAPNAMPMPTKPIECPANGQQPLASLGDFFQPDGEEQRKRARMEGGEEESAHSSPSPVPAAQMDSQQQLKTLKEVLKAASANRLQLQRQNCGNGTGTGSNGTGTPQAKRPQSKGGQGQRSQNNGGQQQATSSQELGAALLPILIQGIFASSSSTSSTPSSPNSSSTSTTFPPLHIRPQQQQRTARASANSGQQQQHLPILYQMPQGVVYATQEHEEEGEQDRARTASCMAAVCSSASAGTSSAGANGPGEELVATTAGNALQQLLMNHQHLLLPLTAASMTQQILTAIKGGGTGAQSSED